MKIDVLFQGFPGKMTRGYMSWSSIIYVEDAGHQILFDTGSMSERSELPNRFKEHNLHMDDIDIVVLSHFHHDHVMNFDYFKNARILLHEKEADWVLSNPGDWAIPKYLFPALQNTGRLELISKDGEIAPGIELLHTPGHTIGCMSMVLRAKKMATTVLAGDAVKNLTELATGKVAMSWDNQASSTSIEKIRDIAKVVIPGHDRILQVMADKIVATTACHEMITIPKGVCDKNNPEVIELSVKPTSLKIC